MRTLTAVLIREDLGFIGLCGEAVAPFFECASAEEINDRARHGSVGVLLL